MTKIRKSIQTNTYITLVWIKTAKSNSTKYRKMCPAFIAKTQEWLDNFLSYKFATCIISNDVRTCASNVCHSYCQRDWPGLKLNFGFH